MRITAFVIATLLSTSSVFAQARAYTDADLGHHLSSDRACPELALATWLDHTGGVPMPIGTPDLSGPRWIVGPTSDWTATLTPTAPLSADAGYCYGCELAHHAGYGYIRRGAPDVSRWDARRARPSTRVPPADLGPPRTSRSLPTLANAASRRVR